MIDRQYDVLDAIVESRDVGALEWFYYNWVNDIPNSACGEIYNSLLEFVEDNTGGNDFIDYFACTFILPFCCYFYCP